MSERPDAKTRPQPTPRRRTRHRPIIFGVLLLGLALFVAFYQHRHAVTVDIGDDIAFTYARLTPLHPFSWSHRTVAVAEHMPETTIPADFAPVICLFQGHDLETGNHWIRTSDRWGAIWIDLDESCVSGSRPLQEIRPESHICGLHYRAELGPASDTEWELLGVITDDGGTDPIFVPGAREFTSDCTWED